MTSTNAIVEVFQALPLPRGRVCKVIPKLVHDDRVYAYNVVFELGQRRRLAVDVRQVPIEVPALLGQYGEMALYITSFESISRQPLTSQSMPCRYLGPQMSLVFFQELLDRYHLLKLQDEQDGALANENSQEDEEEELEDIEEDQSPEEDGVTAFQDRYDEVLEEYHPQGFPLGPYQSVPLLQTPLGTFFLGVKAKEQIEQVIQLGEEVFIVAELFSLASFKKIRKPLFRF